MSFLETVTDQLNLRWAWEKVRRAATPGDVWIDEIELAGFEVELERNLQSIATEIRKGRYRLRPLRPMAFPKNPTKDGIQQVRQYFNVAVRDQVAWTAVVNVIGPHLDPMMPAWSYGNRLFRSIWVDTDEDGIRRRKIGRYRHSSGRIYLPFGQSWPVFRRHVFLATAAMTAKSAAQGSSQFTQEDADELSLQEQLRTQHRCPFVRRVYWNERQPAAGKESLFWCSIDLEKFYPSLKLSVIQRNILEYLPADFKPEAAELIGSMMRFRLDTTGWSNEHLSSIGIKPRQKAFNHIPTGLYVAGFLANAGLLKVDLEVSRRLEKKDVAHFRFVDDHIILAYSFYDLVSWIDEYEQLLIESKTGGRFNLDKIEPQELAKYYSSRKKAGKRLRSVTDAAVTACKLNPQFPTPLMTKTLALVSAIARTDFNLLEESELISLTDQLEHMLLVEIPEAEIPGKTRLSFAATRLMRLAECRLANNSRLAELACRQQELTAELADKELSPERRTVLDQESKANAEELGIRSRALDGEISRACGLLRKVLQERPDRVRLWTRAIQMCRQTGVKGLTEILADIHRVEHEHKNSLAAEYLMANTLSLLGSEARIAAQIVCDEEATEWRRKAARFFLSDVCNTLFEKPTTGEHRWFLQTSWEQYCFGLFCADLIIKASPSPQAAFECALPRGLVSLGESCLTNRVFDGRPVSWAWWAARASLRNLSPRADNWVMEIGRRLPPAKESHAFWRFFPFDIPPDVFRGMRDDKSHAQNVAAMEGWWHDAIRGKHDITHPLRAKSRNPSTARVLRNIQSASDRRWMSLQEWCEGVQKICAADSTDPRAGEWTALEIVRQIAVRFATSQEFEIGYVSNAKRSSQRPPCMHPANFRVPRIWFERWLDGKAPTWNAWFTMICPNVSETQIEIVPEKQRIADSRYTPVSSLESVLFESINPIRGLGLLLYGLLQHSFELPSVWNGPGHADVLSLLPRLLLREMTCSSWTLGVLQGCLQPRAMENIFLRAHQNMDIYLDNDTLNDPIRLLTPEQVRKAIAVCQSVLKNNQLSTLNHRARQLTPISIRQLSQPDWAKVFEHSPEGGGVDEQ